MSIEPFPQGEDSSANTNVTRKSSRGYVAQPRVVLPSGASFNMPTKPTKSWSQESTSRVTPEESEERASSRLQDTGFSRGTLAAAGIRAELSKGMVTKGAKLFLTDAFAEDRARAQAQAEPVGDTLKHSCQHASRTPVPITIAPPSHHHAHTRAHTRTPTRSFLNVEFCFSGVVWWGNVLVA